MTSRHPATFPPAVLDAIDRALGADARYVLDPFAGIGGIHALYPGRCTWGIEIEREWAQQHPFTEWGDARDVLRTFAPGFFDAVATSPAYGNRMADRYDGRDGSRRHTYRLALGRELAPGNGGGLQWGREYRQLHCEVYRACWRVLRPGGLFVLNMKDHIRGGKRQFVTAWHVSALKDLGFRYLGRERVPVGGLRHGTNHQVRLDYEVVARLEKPYGS